MKKVLLLAIAIFQFIPLLAEEIPAGGENMIKDAVTNHNLIGNHGTVSIVSAEHPEFNQSLKVDVTSLPDNLIIC